MHWLVNLRQLVLDPRSDAAATRALAEGRARPPSALRARVEFLRAAWIDAPETIPDLSDALARHAVRVVAAEAGEPSVVRAALRAATTGDPIPTGFAPEETRRHHLLVYRGLRHLESVTHANPWSQATSRAGRQLSNMAPTPFALDGVRFASTESLLQSMRIPPSGMTPTRVEVAAMSASRSMAEGRRALEKARGNTGLRDPVWLWGQESAGPIERCSRGFLDVMTSGLEAKARAHAPVARALAACRKLPIVHYLRGRGRYRLRSSSHLPVCLPEVCSRLEPELSSIVLTEEEVGFWLSPSCADLEDDARRLRAFSNGAL